MPSDLLLVRKHDAELVSTQPADRFDFSGNHYTLRDAVQWLQDGAVVAFAGGRQRLTSGTQNMRGLRMLDDNFYGVPQAIAVPLERKDRLQLVNAALDELRANGFLADSVARSGVEGLTVAPVDTPSR